MEAIGSKNSNYSSSELVENSAPILNLPTEVIEIIFDKLNSLIYFLPIRLVCRQFNLISFKPYKKALEKNLILNIVFHSWGSRIDRELINWEPNDIEEFQMIEKERNEQGENGDLSDDEIFNDYVMVPQPETTEYLTEIPVSLYKQVSQQAMKVASAANGYFGNAKGVSLLLGAGIGASGAFPLGVLGTSLLLLLGETIDVIHDACKIASSTTPQQLQTEQQLFKALHETKPEICSSYSVSSAIRIINGELELLALEGESIEEKYNEMNLRDPGELTLKEIWENMMRGNAIKLKANPGYDEQTVKNIENKNIKKNNKDFISFYLLQLSILNPKRIDLSSFEMVPLSIIELMIQSCKNLKEVVLPFSMESETLLNKYPNIKFYRDDIELLSLKKTMPEMEEKAESQFEGESAVQNED